MLAVATLAVGLGTTLLAPVPSASAAVVPGSQADLQVTVSGPTTANTGERFSYTVVMSNNSLADADGATFTDVLSGGVAGLSATCTAERGAACPAELTVAGGEVSGSIGALPHLGTITVTVTGTFSGFQTVTNTARIDPPSGVTDPDTSTNTSVINTTINNVADVAAVLSTDATSADIPGRIRYTAAVTNNGPGAADGTAVQLKTYALAPDGMVVKTFSALTCTSTGGAVCPTIPSAAGPDGDAPFFDAVLPTLPSGGSVTFVWVENLERGDGPCNTFVSPIFRVSIFTTVPAGLTDPKRANNIGGVDLPLVGGRCQTGDLSAVKSADAPSVKPGESLGYTIVFSNKGPDDLTDVPISDFASASAPTDVFGTHDYSGLTCRATGGATCPSIPASGSGLGLDSYTFQAVIDVLPSGSSLEIRYRDTFSAGAGSCVPVGRLILTNAARIEAPRNVADPDHLNDVGMAQTRVDVPSCAAADLAVTTTTSTPIVTAPGASSHSVTLTNNGPAAADGSRLKDVLRLSDPSPAFGTFAYSGLRCTAIGGAVCPDIAPSRAQLTLGASVFDEPVPTLPAGSSITVTFDTVLSRGMSSCGTIGNVALVNTVEAKVPTSAYDSNAGNNTAQTSSESFCAEVAVNNMVSTTSARTGDTVVYTIQVSNASGGVADNVDFVDQLSPAMRFVSAQCTPSNGAAQCGDVTFDPRTRTVRSVIGSLARSESVTFTIISTAGPTTSTVTNVATATPSSSSKYFDTNPDGNVSRVNVQIFDTLSPVTVTKKIDGLDAAGLADGLTFTGTIACELQPARTWTVTVPAGRSTASAPAILVYDGDTCTVSEDAPPQAPARFTWSPTVLVTPPTFTPSSETPVDVTVTNTLDPVVERAQVTVTKRIEGLTAAGLSGPLTFTGVVACTASDSQTTTAAWEVTVAAGQTSATSSPLTVPAGTRCASSEDAPPSAPSGFRWDAVNADPTTTSALISGSTTDIPVVNRVMTDAPPAPTTGALTIAVAITGGPSDVTGTFSFAVACGQDTLPVTVQIASGTTGSATLPSVAAGTDCTVSATGKTAAPTGYGWGATVIAQPTARIVAGATMRVEVTNPLIPEAGPSGGGPTPGTTPTPGATPTPEATPAPTPTETETATMTGSTPTAATGRRSADASTTLAYTGGQVTFPFVPLGITLIAAGVIALFFIRRRRQSSADRR
ncbi:DUF5979 domain-containing protein [Microbacterium testaceum]|uniref:DUF5979 domain-containing protein n=1 Tax=Microbacterium testaceum TaxID=2033 RepID=UPI0037F65861